MSIVTPIACGDVEAPEALPLDLATALAAVQNARAAMDDLVVEITATAESAGAARDKAQQWATKTDGEVEAGQGYGSKKYAQDAAASAIASDDARGLSVVAKGASEAARDKAQQWATKTDGEVEAGQGYGSKKYAQDAAASAQTSTTQAGISTSGAGTATQKAADAEASRVAAAGALSSVQTLQASTSALALQTQGYMNSAAASAASASAVSGLSNLSAAMRAIALSTGAAFGFLYDTGRDENPNWPDQCVTQTIVTEALNTATRGSTAKYPKRMLLLAYNVALWNVCFEIRDATDPTCPVWASWTCHGSNLFNITSTYNITGIAARAGRIFVTTTAGVAEIDLIADRAIAHQTATCYVYQGLVNRNANAPSAYYSTTSVSGGPFWPPVNNTCNDVDATVLPHTQPNPLRCGLPNPTVAVATGGGTSVIRSDGVVNNSSSTVNHGSVSFDAAGRLWVMSNSVGATCVCSPSAFLTASFAIANVAQFTTAQVGVGTMAKVRAIGPNKVAVAGSTGLAQIMSDPVNPANSLINNISTAYNDGWKAGAQGGIKFASAESSADTSNQTASVVLSDNFHSYASTAAMLAAGWSDSTSSGGSISWDAANGGQLLLTKTTGLTSAARSITLTPGWWLVSVTTGAVPSGGGYFVAGLTNAAPPYSAAAGFVAAGYGNSTIPLQIYVATTTTYNLVVYNNFNNAGSVEVRSVTVSKVIADRSPAVTPSVINGTVVRGAVATGADLAYVQAADANSGLAPAIAYPGSSSDLRLSSWINNSVGGAVIMGWDIAAPNDGTTNSRLGLVLGWGDVNGAGTFAVAERYSNLGGSVGLLYNQWYKIDYVIRRAASRAELYVNGVLRLTGAIPGSANNSPATFTMLNSTAWTHGTTGLKCALQKVEAVAPTPDQIAFMYEQEKGRFQAGDKCLASGANIQALAYDPDTDQIAAANSTAGVDVFKGIGRVANYNSATASTNKLRNSRMIGAVAGAIGSGGALPTNWSKAGDGGLTTTVVGSGVLPDGSAYLDLQVAGTPNSTGNFVLYLESSSFIAAASGQAWAAGVGLQLVAGAMTNIGSGVVGLSIEEHNSGGSYLTASNTTLAPSSTAARLTTARTLSNGSTAYVTPSMFFGITNGSAINLTLRISAPKIEQAASASAYTDGLSSSANAKAVAFAGGDLVVATAGGVDAFLASAPGLRETAKGRKVANPYDPTIGRFYGVTTDATPTVFGAVPIPEGKAFRFRRRVAAVQYGGVATEKAAYMIEGIATRDIGGNVSVVSTTTTISEVTSTMDCVAQANTTAQTLEFKGTGKSGTRMAWMDSGELVDVGLGSAA